MRSSWMAVVALAAATTLISAHNHNTGFHTPEFCQLEPDTGHCPGYEPRWYFNIKIGTCVRFMYRGCGGNLNNFRSKVECLRTCTGTAEEETTPSQQSAENPETVVENNVNLDNMNIKDPQDMSALQDLVMQDNVEVNQASERKEEEPKVMAKVVEEVEDDKPVDLTRYTTNPNDLEALGDLLANKNVQNVDEFVPLEESKDREELPEATVFQEDDDNSEVDVAKMGIPDGNDKSTLEQLLAQDNMEIEEVVPVKETEEQKEESNEPLAKVVRVEEDDSDINVDMLHITDPNDLSTFEQLLTQDNMQVEEMVPVDMSREEVEDTDDVEDQDQEESMPFIKVIREEDDDSDVDMDKLHIDNVMDRMTLEQLLSQDNMVVEEVVPVAEAQNEEPRLIKVVREEESTEDPDLSHLNGDPQDLSTLQDLMSGSKLPVKEVKPLDEEENEETPIKVVKTVEDDSPVDIDRLYIDDAYDQSTLEQLMAQDNMNVEEIEQVNENEDVQPLMKVVKEVEDDSDVNFERLHITDANDQLTLEQLLSQDNMQVEEVVPVEDSVDVGNLNIDDGNDKSSLEQLMAQDNMEVEKLEPVSDENAADEPVGPFIKVVREEDDDSDVNMERLHITDANDRSTLEQLLSQDNMIVEEVEPVQQQVQPEEENDEDPEQPLIKVVEEIDNDDSDVELNRLHITDANDRSSLEQLMSQDNMAVEEVIPLNENQESNSENEVESYDAPFIKVVAEEDDDSDVDMEKLHITDANDRSTLEQLLSQDNMVVEEVVPIKNGDDYMTSEENIPAKVGKEVHDDSEVNTDALNIDDARDKSTLDQLMAQDNMSVEEAVPVSEEEDNEEMPFMKVVKEIDDDSDVDMERLHINDANDRLTLEQLLAQDNMEVEEVVPVEANDSEEEEDGQSSTENIIDANDKSALEQLMAQDNMAVQEVEPVEENNEDMPADENNKFEEMKVVKVEEDDDSDVDMNSLHIDNIMDRSTLEQLLAQDNMKVSEVVPLRKTKKEKTWRKKMPWRGSNHAALQKYLANKRFNAVDQRDAKENSIYDKLASLRNKYMKKPGTPNSPVFFTKKVVEETTETETTEYLRPEGGHSNAVPMCCTHRADPGHCNQKTMQWFYDVKLKTCVPFTYSGCGGNRNRFETIGACLMKCGGITRSAPMPPRPSMPEHVMEERRPEPNMVHYSPMLPPYKALLSNMTPRMKPMLAILASIKSGLRQAAKQHMQMPPEEPIKEVEPKDSRKHFIRILFRGRPLPAMEPPRPFMPRMSERQEPRVQMQKRVHMNHFAPQFRKEVVMAPENFDNRFQSHSTPHNKVTLVQVFVNKKGKGRHGGRDRYQKYERIDRPDRHGRRMKPWARQQYKPNHNPHPQPQPQPHGHPDHYHHKHDGLPMHMHPYMPTRPSPSPRRPWWTRFARPITFPRPTERDRVAYDALKQRFESTTYPPDYPKWSSKSQVSVSRVDWQTTRNQILGNNKMTPEEWHNELTGRMSGQSNAEEEEVVEVVEEQAGAEADKGPSYVCLLPVATGPCKALDERFWFNQKDGKCQKFYYGGCRGNGNNFKTEAECMQTCEGSVDESTPAPEEEVIFVTENVYGPPGEVEVAEEGEGKAKVQPNPEIIVTADPKSAEQEILEVEEEKPVESEEESKEVEEEAKPEVGRLELSSETEYIIIIAVMALVGLIVIILLAFSVAHLMRRFKKSKKEKIVEAVVAQQCYNSDFPKLVYYGHTIVPPSQDPEVPDVHTLNNTKQSEDV